MTRAGGVSETPRNPRHAARDSRHDRNKKHKISVNVILDLKFKNTLWNFIYLVSERWIAIQNNGEIIWILSLIFLKTQKQKKRRL